MTEVARWARPTGATTDPAAGPALGADEARSGRLRAAATVAQGLDANLSLVVKGAPAALRVAIVAALSGGHLLIEDVPGVGKTVLARTLALSLGAELTRVQGHPDLLPGDFTGVTVYDQRTGEWEFRQGPVFSHVVLLDELNRTPPRTQSALLESMDEQQVTVDGQTWPLPQPHLVLATQNPVEQAGTYPLVESQMDRFLLATRLGYPDAKTEAAIALDRGAQQDLALLEPVCSPRTLAEAQAEVANLHVHEAVADYAVALVRASRSLPEVRLGASPRATIAVLAAARAEAALSGRGYVTPGDVKRIAAAALGHRLVVDAPQGLIDSGAIVVRALLESVPSPRP